MKKILSTIMIVILLAILTNVNANTSQAATTLKISTKKISLTVGKTKTVYANKKVTWSSSNKKIATVKKINSKKAKIRAVKSGSCKIIVKSGKKKKNIQVTVKSKTSNQIITSPTPAVTECPIITTPATTPDVSTLPENTPISDIYTEVKAGITVKTVSSSATSARIEIKNDNNAEVIYGEEYQLQKLVNGNWEKIVPIVDNVVFPVIGTGLLSNTTGYINVNWKEYYGHLESGQYRIVKEYSIYGATYKIATQFELEDDKSVENNKKADHEVYSSSIANIMLKTVSSSATSARIEIRNDNNTDVIYGEEYQLQKLVNGTWEKIVPIVDNLVFPAVGTKVLNSTTGYIDINWNNYYGKLENGQYRIVKEYVVNGNCYKIASIFEIK